MYARIGYALGYALATRNENSTGVLVDFDISAVRPQRITALFDRNPFGTLDATVDGTIQKHKISLSGLFHFP